MNLLGKRETQIYGENSFDVLIEKLREEFSDIRLDYIQSNHEGEIIDALQGNSHQGIVLNAGGYTHTSVSIRDAIAAIDTPVIEVHISNIAARESFRHDSLISPVCKGCIFGFGTDSYRLAIKAFVMLG